jgi:hypothetical protein
MLPAEEYTYLKRKYEAEQAARLKAARQRQQSYDATAFAHAMHGMPAATPRYPPRKDSYFRMKPGRSAKPQPKYKNKKKCAQVALPPKPKPEYSNAQFRRNHVYKPQGLSGKAGEVLGVTNKRKYAGRPAPGYAKRKPIKPMKKAYIKNATKPLPPLPKKYKAPKAPKGYRKPKEQSTGCCIVM